MKRAFAIFTVATAIVACADIARSGKPRGIRFPDMKIRICQNDRHGFEVTEDATLFYSNFALLNYPEYILNFAEHKQLAVAVAKTIADFLGSTNDIRVVHWEQPEPASTNIADQILARLKGEWVTDEIIPIGTGAAQ